MKGLLLLLGLVACVDPPTPDSRIACAVDTSAHPAHAELQSMLDDVVAKGVPGIALSVETDDGVWQGAAGYADVEDEVAMTPCHVHPWASIGKTWYAALALRLVDEGRLDLDARIVDVLDPEALEGLANIDRITIRQLLLHASGLKDFNEDAGYLSHEFDHPSGDDTPNEVLDYVRGDPAFFEPGEGYHYSDTAYMLIALAIEAITGDRVAAMTEHVFEPLGLEHTELPQGGPDPEGRVNAYWELPAGQLENVSELQASYDVQVIGAGNLRSTPEDSLRFIGALARGELLEAATQAALTDWNPASERDDGYAYGLGVQRRIVPIDGQDTQWVGHAGGDIGASALVLARQDAPHTFAAVLNLGGFLGGPLNAHVDDDFIDEVLRIVAGAP